MTLNAFMIDPIIRQALAEDLGRAGDLTTDALIPEEAESRAVIATRKDAGFIAGLPLVERVFQMLDTSVHVSLLHDDGDEVASSAQVLELSGPTRALLTGERVALNFLCHLSGIATETARYVTAVAGTDTAITCTRKTTPGLRALQKYAIRMGGGRNHRFGLDDAVMVKDNHLVAAGSIKKCIQRLRSQIGHMVKIELEVDTIDQLQQALDLNVDVILLDNMQADDMQAAVALRDLAAEQGHHAVLEASGGVTLDTVRGIAETGVDVISVGAITHSAPILDMGLDFID